MKGNISIIELDDGGHELRFFNLFKASQYKKINVIKLTDVFTLDFLEQLRGN